MKLPIPATEKIADKLKVLDQEVKKISIYNAETDQTEEFEYTVDSDGNLAPLDATDDKKAPAKPKSKIILERPKKWVL